LVEVEAKKDALGWGLTSGPSTILTTSNSSGGAATYTSASTLLNPLASLKDHAMIKGL
jgi:hypothetical protein